MAEHRRVQLITAASANVREPSPELLKFIESQEAVQGDALVVSILARMQSPQACNLIEKRFYSSDYQDQRKIGWFKWEFITERDAPAMVAMYKRILSAEITASDLRNMVVLTLFDYQPEEWYGDPSSRWPKVPARRDASSEALKELLVIAKMCDKLDLEKDTRESVARERKKIEIILEFRALGADGHAKLIRELNNEDFKVRDRAHRELERFGDAAEPMLRDALKGEHPFETRQRIEKILAKLKK